MKQEPMGFAGGLWLMVIGTFMSLGFAGGYLVASNESSTALRKKQEEWSAKSKAYAAEKDEVTAELEALKGSLAHRDGQIASQLKKSAELERELQQVQLSLAREREEHAAGMKQYEEIKQVLSRDYAGGGSAWEHLEKARKGFRSIKVEVDAGRFQGLKESSGFQILDAAFESVPEKK
jgi:chromosome segregation ATPase